MKTVSFPASALAVLAAALVAASMPVSPVFAQNQTDAKIRLMSEALRARDAGDLAAAQQALAKLASLSPNDPAVQKLRAEIEAQAVAQQNALAQRAAAEAAAAAAAQAAADRAKQATADRPTQPVTVANPSPSSPESSRSSSSSARPQMIDVTIPLPGQTPPSVPLAQSAASQEVEAMARAESDRIAQ